MKQADPAGLHIRFASKEDVPLILQFIKELASYEKLSHEVVTDEETLRASLFGDRHVAEVVIGELAGKPAAFAVFFHNFSTFLGRPGLYLEDLFVRPEFRRLGLGRALLAFLADLAQKRGCGRFEWWVLDWNKKAIRFYQRIGARPMNEWTVFRVDGESLSQLAQESKF